MLNPCIDPTLNWINVPEIRLDEVTYLINSRLLAIEGIPALFSVQNPLCGSLTLNMSVNSDSTPVKFEDDSFEVYTSNLSLGGTVEVINIYAALDDYPTIAFKTPSETYLQSSLTVELPVKLENCVITTVEKPTVKSLTYEFGSGEKLIEYEGFKSSEGDPCNYVWSYTARLGNDDSLPSDLIVFDEEKLIFKIDADSGSA